MLDDKSSGDRGGDGGTMCMWHVFRPPSRALTNGYHGNFHVRCIFRQLKNTEQAQDPIAGKTSSQVLNGAQ